MAHTMQAQLFSARKDRLLFHTRLVYLVYYFYQIVLFNRPARFTTHLQGCLTETFMEDYGMFINMTVADLPSRWMIPIQGHPREVLLYEHLRSKRQ